MAPKVAHPGVQRRPARLQELLEDGEPGLLGEWATSLVKQPREIGMPTLGLFGGGLFSDSDLFPSRSSLKSGSYFVSELHREFDTDASGCS